MAGMSPRFAARRFDPQDTISTALTVLPENPIIEIEARSHRTTRLTFSIMLLIGCVLVISLYVYRLYHGDLTKALAVMAGMLIGYAMATAVATAVAFLIAAKRS